MTLYSQLKILIFHLKIHWNLNLVLLMTLLNFQKIKKFVHLPNFIKQFMVYLLFFV